MKIKPDFTIIGEKEGEALLMKMLYGEELPENLSMIEIAFLEWPDNLYKQQKFLEMSRCLDVEDDGRQD